MTENENSSTEVQASSQSVSADGDIGGSPATVADVSAGQEKKVKYRKEYDRSTNSYVMVAKNQPLKVLVSLPRTSKRWVTRYIKSAFKKVNLLDSVTMSKRVSKRRAQNRIASKMKWANYHRESR